MTSEKVRLQGGTTDLVMRDFWDALCAKWQLIIVSAVALAIVIVRAAHQSVTWDEAATYLTYVFRSDPSLWSSDSNNHVLNSLLESLFVHVFQPTQFVIRMPAICGAIIYIGCAFALCDRYVRDRYLAVGSLACLVFNPFVMDYMVAARGYSLSLAFLMTAVLLLSFAREFPARRVFLVACASTAIGFSIASNYSFAIAGLVLLAYFFASFLRGLGVLAILKIATAAIIPAPLAAIAICGPAILHFRSSELVYGATSTGQMLGSIFTNTFDGPNPYIINKTVMPFFVLFRDIAPYLFLGVIVTSFAVLIRRKLVWSSLGTHVLIVLIVTVALEIALASFSHAPLPLNRTILFAAPLLTLVVCFGVATAGERRLAFVATCLLATTACFFLSSVRDYFREWAFDAGVAPIYHALSRIEASSRGLTIGTDVKFFYALNFYQAIDPNPQGPPFDLPLPPPGIPGDRSVYVLSDGDDDDFIKAHGLVTVYSYPQTDSAKIMIAVKPGVYVPPLPLPPST